MWCAHIFDQEMRGLNESGQVYPGYSAPVVTVRGGEETLERMRWGMPGPVFPPQPGEKPKRPGFITNVRNTASGHWKPWLAGTEVAAGKDNNCRCIVPAAT